MRAVIGLFILLWVSNIQAQNVGVFTNSPQSPFHIFSSTTNPGDNLVVLGDTTAIHARINIDRIQINRFDGQFHNPLDFYLQPEGGNVGINTTGPAAPLHLWSEGDVNLLGGLAIIGNTSKGHLEVDYDRIQSNFNNAPLKMRIQQNGGDLDLSDGGIAIDKSNTEIGFMIANPEQPFHFNGSGQVNTPGGFAVFGNTSEGHLELDYDRLQSNFGLTSNLTLKLQPDGGNLNVRNGLLYVHDDSTAVGIGTSAPDAKLNVKGSGFNSTTAAFHVENGLNQSLLYVNDLGYVGIDGIKSPTSTLDVNGGIEIQTALASGDNTNSKLEFENLGDDIVIDADGNELMRFDGSEEEVILSTGVSSQVNIGGGTTSAKLNVNAPAGVDPFVAKIQGISRFVIQQDDGHVGVRISSPDAYLHVQASQNIASSGILLENLDDDGRWQFVIDEDDDLTLLTATEDGQPMVEVGHFGNGGVYAATSDARLKKNIADFDEVLPRVEQLRPVQYHFLGESEHEKQSVGFLAQDVEPLFPELVHYKVSRDRYTMNYAGFAVIAIKAIQELSDENDALQRKCAHLEARLGMIEELLDLDKE